MTEEVVSEIDSEEAKRDKFSRNNKKSKQKGSSYEYRVRDFFNKIPGWKSERNPLSGAVGQICSLISKHDVRATNEALGIFLQVECKKKGFNNKSTDSEIIVQKEWIDKIDQTNDEILCIGFNRSPTYVFLERDRFFQILCRSFPVNYDKNNTYKGKSSLTLHLKDIEKAKEEYHLFWNSLNKHYVVITLERFIELRSTVVLNKKDLTPEEKIKRLQGLDELEKFEKENLGELNYSQKKMLYTKAEQLESGSFINPMESANQQFWLKGDAFVCVCPHCDQKIHKKDLTNKKEKKLDELNEFKIF